MISGNVSTPMKGNAMTSRNATPARTRLTGLRRRATTWIDDMGNVGVARAIDPYEVALLILDDGDLYEAIADDDDVTAAEMTPLELLSMIKERLHVYRVPTSVYAACPEVYDAEHLTPWSWDKAPGSGYVLIAWVLA